ncbi:calcium/sodium antiporter [Suttonella sp. R2A3]|uniref:calcium/sodium antiporter n=1 Tax=Suttonella sp. R2A3 TaxID=2908648 RepID=UPI0038FC3FF8
MPFSVIAIIIGLLALIWSADYFIDGAAGLARQYGMPPLLVGMVIIGFGTSAPEMVVSAFAAWQGTPGLALGNAYGSNIANIGLIIGVTALLMPIAVHSQVLKKEFPILLAVTGLAAWQVSDASITRLEAWGLLAVFFALMAWTIYQGMRHPNDYDRDDSPKLPVRRAWMMTVVGLLVLMAASRGMVWGAANIASHFGVDDLLIGLTVFAVGTSLPELASTLTAVRKNQPDIAIGNIIGSNLFNTLAVVGIAGIIHPMDVSPAIFTRDMPVMAAMTVILMLMGLQLSRRRGGRINRVEGALLLCAFIAYNAYLIHTILPASI